MSLNRVASIETLADHHARRGSDASIRPRKLSFNPLPQEWDPAIPDTKPGHHQPEQGGISAFDVPQWKRIRMFSTKTLTLATPFLGIPTDVLDSPDLGRRCILPLRRRCRFWIRCHKASPQIPRRLCRHLSRLCHMHRDPPQLHVHRRGRRHEPRGPSRWSYP